MEEKKIPNTPEPPTIEEMTKALQQLKYSICKIFKANGTGFFCFIPYKNRFLRVLITNYHVINEQFIKENNKIKFGIDDEKYLNDIFLNDNRKIYLNESYDLAMIEITDQDQLNKDIIFLNFDDYLFQKDSDLIYSTKNSIYILQYPNLGKARVSWGIIKEINSKEIKHLCSTEYGSSGSPILYLKTNKVIGIHKGHSKFNFNMGIFLKEPIKKLNQNNEMKKIYQIKYSNNYNYPNNNYNYNCNNICNNNFINNYINNYNFINNLNNKNNFVSSFNQNNIIQQINVQKFQNKQIKNYSQNQMEKYNNFNICFHGNQNKINLYENKTKKKYEKTIEDGIYKIIPMHCNNRAIDINGASPENNANLQLYEYNNTNAQRFEVKYNNKDNYYTIRCLCSNKLLTVNSNDNYNIVQFDETQGINQQWHIVRIGNNYEIISEYKGYLMDVNNKGDNNFTNISCKPKIGELNQQFQFKNAEYFIKPSYEGCSIVDALEEIHVDSSQSYRSKIAAANGIENYKYTPEQNTKMLNMLKEGKLKIP